MPIEPHSNAIVSFKNVRKKRGHLWALDGLDFEIKKGEILCLLGPNGAGKSTALLHILGLMTPDEGSIEVFNGKPSALSTKRKMGCTPQDSGFLEHATLTEVLELVAAHYPNPRNIAETLKEFGISQLAHRQTRALSGGQRRCLSLACAFVGNPELVLLDEPTTGVDVDVRRRLWQIIREYSLQGGTVLLTTHYLEEAEELATRIVVVQSGRVLTSGDLNSIKAQLGLKQVEFRAKPALRFSADFEVNENNGHYRVLTANADSFVRDLAINHPFTHLEVKGLSLEEAFLKIVEETKQ
ncbi:MAG: hypothetical protein RJB66_190 [Pseudomonadota bacterium]|jgi:ABC-2 type transport system ATP-binding protein